MTAKSKAAGKSSNGSGKGIAGASAGGETHQTTDDHALSLTTNEGAVVSDNQNSLKQGARGPTLLEDHFFRQKIMHFDHERIPERIVHARGSGAHGYFQPAKSFAHLTRAAFLQDPKKKTPVFVRFSTVAGGAGSGDLPRDVRGFAVKFYTEEGNFDLVGNNIPVFFIQDAIKFPDLIHSVKMEADRGYPQAATAHDTFWDFASLTPESMHMLMWAMSDRAIPRSLRMMEGFGIHTFRFVNAEGKSTFVKFHWRPTIGSSSVVWDEALKINGGDPDFHRRDLFEAIEKGDFPEFEFAVQAFDDKVAQGLPFDVLDPTKIIPEEVVPLTVLGTMVLDRNPDNFFQETEQAAYHPGNIVPGIDFTNDPLLQGRLFSYLDTQLIRLGGPNFHQIPINQPKCPMRNFQRDGFMRISNPPGRANYEPNSIDAESPRENPTLGFRTFAPADSAAPNEGDKVRLRPESFADHYSQARLFFRSMSEPEKRHIISAFTFELGKVATLPIRKRMLGHLMIVDKELGMAVEAALGMEGEADKITPVREPIDLDPSPALSIILKAPKILKGKKVGVMVTDGSDATLVDSLKSAVENEGAVFEIVAPKVGGVKTADGKKLAADHGLTAGSSIFFDAVVLAASAEGCKTLMKEAAAVNWLRDAFGHLKVIGYTPDSLPLLEEASIAEKKDEGMIEIAVKAGISAFIEKAKQYKIWEREPKLRSPG
jgi:catalase